MDDEFYLPVFYKEQELNFPAQLITSGYAYKIQVTVNESSVLYEKDDGGEWRALIGLENLQSNIDIELLKAIATSLDEIFA